MRRVAGKHFSLLRVCSVGLCLSLLTACVSEEARKAGVIGLETYQISAPSLEGIRGEEGGELTREKVASIVVTTPKKGDRLTSVRVAVRRSWGDAHKFGSNYILGKDLEPVVREALSDLYEIETSSSKTVEVTVATYFSHSLNKTVTCRPWITSVRVAFFISESSTDGAAWDKSYGSTVTGKACTYLFTMPLGSDIEDPFHEAFSQALLKVIEDRRAGERAQRVSEAVDGVFQSED